MNPWQERMATARFGSVEFKTDSHEAKFGRRLAMHEFPGSDLPLVEDLGEKAREWRLNAYFIGPNYDEARDTFLEVLNTQGADWLTHPWLGRLWARARSWSVSESNDKGGYCTIGVDFVHGGQTDNAPSVDVVDVAITRLGDLSSASIADFSLEAMSAGGMTAFVAAVSSKLDTLRNAISLATLPLTWASQIRTLGAGIQEDLQALMAVPAQYATALAGMTDVLGAGSDRDDVADTDRPRLVHCVCAAATSGATQAIEGVAATDGAVRRNLIREAALRSRLLVTAAAQIALADYRAEADRDAALTTAVAALDALLPSLTDAVFEVAVTARSALIEAVLAQDLQPAMVRDVSGPLPAALLAHRMSVDESVFLARNAVRHPLFVSGRVYG